VLNPMLEVLVVAVHGVVTSDCLRGSPYLAKPAGVRRQPVPVGRPSPCLFSEALTSDG